MQPKNTSAILSEVNTTYPNSDFKSNTLKRKETQFTR